MMFEVLQASGGIVDGTQAHQFDVRIPSSGDMTTVHMQVIEISDLGALVAFTQANKGRLIIDTFTDWVIPFPTITVYDDYVE